MCCHLLGSGVARGVRVDDVLDGEAHATSREEELLDRTHARRVSDLRSPRGLAWKTIARGMRRGSRLCRHVSSCFGRPKAPPQGCSGSDVQW